MPFNISHLIKVIYDEAAVEKLFYDRVRRVCIRAACISTPQDGGEGKPDAAACLQV
jgi:hypothetical protein